MKLNLREVILFGILGALLFVSKVIMEVLPNVHLLALFIVAFTAVFRQKALYPITVYVFLQGLWIGFSTWWIPNLYIWTILWGMVMLIPQKASVAVRAVLYTAAAALHGFLFGTLWAPAQALLVGLSFEGTLAWIASGLPFDVIHGISNAICGFLIMPLVRLLEKLSKKLY